MTKILMTPPRVRPAIAVQYGVRSDKGRVRENNEDCIRVEQEMNLFVLSDGMGGASCGEVASRLTVDAVIDHCLESYANPTLSFLGKPIEGVTPVSNRLASGIRLANRIVYESAQDNAQRYGMGATVVAACCTEDRMCLAHVGDSRAYLLREEHLQQLTADHSFLAMGLGASQENHDDLQAALTRAVGVDPEVDVDVSEELLMDGDTVLLCSDGLIREVSDTEIVGILGEANDLQKAADALVRLANQAGGRDNISVIVFRLAPETVGAFSSIGRLGKWFCGRGGQS